MATVNASCLLPPGFVLPDFKLHSRFSSYTFFLRRPRAQPATAGAKATAGPLYTAPRAVHYPAAALRGSVSGSREPGLPGALLPAWLTSLTPHGALARISAPLLSILGLLGPQCLLLLKPQMFLYVNSTDVNASLNL